METHTVIYTQRAQDAGEEIAPHFKGASSFQADSPQGPPNKTTHISTNAANNEQR